VRARDLNLIGLDTPAEPEPGESTYIALPEPENPYKGLRAFQAADARDFFGREKLVQRLVQHLGGHDRPARFLAVVGPSGSGKSSVVNAGLVPALWRGDLPGSERWFVVEMIPGAHPLDELEIALTRVAANQSGNLREHLERDPRGLVRVAGLILPDDGSELVVIVDQFEEVFTLVDEEAGRTRFLDLLVSAATDPRSRVRVIMTLRADFYDRPLHYPQFGELVRMNMETVMPLSADELEAAIARPAARVGVTFEPGLVATITGDVHYQPGALPLLQYALTELFEQRTNRTLTHEAYQALGGAAGALTRRAEELYHEQDSVGQETLRQMFLRLVTLGEGVEDTRRRVLRAELLAIDGNEDRMDEAIDTYAAYRLLTLDHDPTTRRPTVEIAHEAILREWERLRAWLNESRADIRQQRVLAAAADEWQRGQQDNSYLLRGARLKQIEEWAAETELVLTQHEQNFLYVCIAERERQEATERERQAREAALKQRAQRVLQVLVGVFLLAAVVGIGLAVFAFDRERRAQDAREVAQVERDNARREADLNRSLVLANAAVKQADSDGPGYALPLALEAVNMDQPPAEAVNALQSLAFNVGTRAILREQGNTIKAVAISPDTRFGLSGSCSVLQNGVCSQGELILWDLDTQREIRRFEGHTGWVNSVAFSPDGAAILSASDDGTLRLWDVASGGLIRRFEEHTGAVKSMALSPDGQTAVSGGAGGIVIVWNVTTGDMRYQFDTLAEAVNHVALSPDGHIAACDAGSEIILWDVTTGQETRRLTGHIGGITALTFRPIEKGRYTLLSAATDVSVREWNVETGQISRQSTQVTFVHDMAVSQDGRTILWAAGFTSGIWNQAQWQFGARINEEYGEIRAQVISSDGRFALVGQDSGLLRIVGLPVSAEARRFQADVPMVSVDISSNGRFMLTGSLAGGVAVLWDLETGQEIRRFEGNEKALMVVKFSPDGRLAALGSLDVLGTSGAHKLVLVDVETGEEVHRLEGHEFPVRSMAFSPDGRYLLTGSLQWGAAWPEEGGGDLILWDVATGTLVRRFDEHRAVMGIAFSPDSSQVATTTGAYGSPVNGEFGDVKIWDFATGQLIHDFRNLSEMPLPFDVAWESDGASLLVGVVGGVVELNIQTGAVTRAFPGLSNIPFSVDVSSDGHYLAGGDSTAPYALIIWDLTTGEQVYNEVAYNVPVWNVFFNPHGQTLFTSTFGDAPIIEWRIPDWALDDLLAWVHENRYVRDFTCAERAQYRIEPLCGGK
jgi:WD40 repeat protein